MVFSVENESQGKLVEARRKFQETSNKPLDDMMEGDFSLKIKFKSRKEKFQFYSGDREFVREKYEEAEEELEKVHYLIILVVFCYNSFLYTVKFILIIQAKSLNFIHF